MSRFEGTLMRKLSWRAETKN